MLVQGLKQRHVCHTCCKMQGCAAMGILDRSIASCLQELVDDVQMTVFGGQMQSGPALASHCIYESSTL